MNKGALKNVVAGQTLFVVEGHHVYQYPFVTTEIIEKRRHVNDVFRVIVLRNTTRIEYAVGGLWVTYEAACESIVKKLIHQEKQLHKRHKREVQEQESRIRNTVDEISGSAREKILILDRLFGKSNDKHHTTP